MPLVLVDELGPQQGVAQEVHRRDLDQLRAEVHRDGEEADHAHVVEAGQPADHDVPVDVVLGADEHRLGVGVDVAVGDLHGLRRASRAGRQLHQRQVVLADLDGVDRIRRQQVGNGEDLDALLLEHGDGHQEGLRDDDGLGLDHADDVHGVLGPHGQVRARCGLVQHGQAGPTHPQALRRRCDLHRQAGEHTDRVTEADARGGQAARDATSALVDLAPGVADGFVGFTGDHARRRVAGVVEHLLGKPAHKNLLGSGGIPKARDLIFRPLGATW